MSLISLFCTITGFAMTIIRKALPVIFMVTIVFAVAAADLVILHTNDTHSQIDPTDKDLGGVQRRKVFVDSVRAACPNVLLVDAGDAVQGTLFFTLYGGEVEMKVMNALGYDLRILGNHDFDNGVGSMAGNVTLSDAQWISTNYKFADPKVQPLFAPYKIYETDGRKIAFIGLNVEPKGMIAEGNYDGVEYLDPVDAADATAWWLKNQLGADYVVALSHLGYDNQKSPSDVELVKSTKNVDIVLGGHSHTVIKPGSGDEWVKNSIGKPVLVTQNGKSGQYITEVTIDLDSLLLPPRYRQILLDSSYDRSYSDSLESCIAPYRKGVDLLMSKVIGKSAVDLPADRPGLLNFVSDFCYDMGCRLAGRPVDLALMNSGSLRRGLGKGDVTQGQIISMQPFTNHVLVMEIKGSDLIDAMNVYASRNGDGVSDQVRVTFDPLSHKVVDLTVGGKPVDPDKSYLLATIDYLAHGGDYMAPLTRGKIIATSPDIVYNDLIAYIKQLRHPINPSSAPRFVPIR